MYSMKYRKNKPLLLPFRSSGIRMGRMGKFKLNIYKNDFDTKQ